MLFVRSIFDGRWVRSAALPFALFVSLLCAAFYVPQTSFAATGKSSKPGVTRIVRTSASNPSERRLVALLDAVTALSRRDDIAYVWGGRATSSPVVCTACQRCIEKRKVNPYRRLAQCPACEQCGVDCSGFVSRVMGAAGLGSTRITSQSLIRHTKKRDLSFKPVGRNLDLARPGDLIVLADHVVIFLDRHENRKLDYVHASRFIPGRPAGGIEVVAAGDLPRGQKPVTILRHKAFEGAGNSAAVRHRINAMLGHTLRKKKIKPVLPVIPGNVRLARAH